ncbi:MAG: ribonuclease III [Thiotrichales bacterium]
MAKGAPIPKRRPRIFRLLDEDVLRSDLLDEAITHRSASKKNNERLEFLGDSVLSLVMSEYLHEHHPDADEGDLSRLRSYLVRGASLAVLAQREQLGEHLVLGQGELKSGGYRRDSILADAVEAIIGAVFKLKGFDYSRRFVLELFADALATLPPAETLKDPKSRLQEWLQSRGMSPPQYTVLSVTGEAHRQTVTAACIVAPLELRAIASASSRRGAEQEAAHQVLNQLLSKTN